MSTQRVWDRLKGVLCGPRTIVLSVVDGWLSLGRVKLRVWVCDAYPIDQARIPACVSLRLSTMRQDIMTLSISVGLPSTSVIKQRRVVRR
jgi:hypothetical protein